MWPVNVRQDRHSVIKALGSGEDELAVVETSIAAGQKRKNYRDSGPRLLSVSKEFPDASYRRPAAGQMLGITDQPDKLCMLLSYAVRQVI
jgi:hypothetical protein